MTRWDGEISESEHERCGMRSHANRVNCGGGMGETKYVEMVWTYR